ncbi:zf-HC2 domain-containing protein [Rossellomorea marisflavi]|uniref:anti-sigma factor family protein n=1 Tax=Rossellomorea marisflavi TaxID=189381 RepID=UPI003458EEF9
MRDVPCRVIEDLLPLYHDDVCSEESRTLVEGHLSQCEACRNELQRMRAGLPVEEKVTVDRNSDDRVMKGIASSWKKGRKRSFWKGIVLAALLLGCLVLTYEGLFNWDIIDVGTEDAKVTQVSLHEDKMFYYLHVDDGYAIQTMINSKKEDGTLYITAKRPIIKRKADATFTFENSYEFIDLTSQNAEGKEVKAIYFGTPEDRKLIWKEGMDLPKTEQSVLERFGME